MSRCKSRSISCARILAGADADVYIQSRALEPFALRYDSGEFSGLAWVVGSRLLWVFWIAWQDAICSHSTGLCTSIVVRER